MAKTTTNLELRGNRWWYRKSFSIDGKVHQLRLSLNTGCYPVARERAARLDLELRRAVQQVNKTSITSDELISLAREWARSTRDRFEQQDAADEADGESLAERVAWLRASKDIAKLGFEGLREGDFGNGERFVEEIIHRYADSDHLLRMQDIWLHSKDLPERLSLDAKELLARRNVVATEANLVLAKRHMMAAAVAALDDKLRLLENPTAALQRITAEIDFNAFIGTAQAAPVVVPFAHHPTSVAAQPSTLAASNDLVSSGSGDDILWTVDFVSAAKLFREASPKLDVGQGWTAKTEAQFLALVALAMKFFKGKPVSKITQADIAAFVRTLRRLPSNHHKPPRHREMSLEDIIVESSTSATLGHVTINRHVTFMRRVVEWLHGSLGMRQFSWAAFVMADDKSARDARAAFEVDELKNIFHAPIWVGGQSKVRRLNAGTHIWWDAAYWLPLIAVYTGARREEIAKLLVSDIKCLDGIWYFSIAVTDAGRLKNAASAREIPIARELLRLGFMAFVAECEARGDRLLFEELASTSQTMGDVFYKRHWRALCRAGYIPENRELHSIRHYVVTELKHAGIAEELRSDLVGHTVRSETGGRYSKKSRLTALQVVVDAIPVVTRHLEPRTAGAGQ